MAAVTAGSEVIERQTQVRSLLDRDLMIGVQMPLTLAEPFPQLGQNLVNGWRTQLELSEVLHDVWLPATIHTAPLVAEEAENPQSAMVGVIAALCRSPSPLIVLPLCLPFVLRAIRSRVAKNPASRRVAWTLG
jgi:hypothetical protein